MIQTAIKREVYVVLFLLMLVVCKSEVWESLKPFNNSLPEAEEQLVFENGTWSCGYCTGMDHLKMIHKEVTTIDKRRIDAPLDIQTEVGIQGMKCVTFTGKNMDQVIVTRISGECHGTSALFRVKSNIDTINVEITVYGEHQLII